MSLRKGLTLEYADPWTPKHSPVHCLSVDGSTVAPFASGLDGDDASHAGLQRETAAFLAVPVSTPAPLSRLCSNPSALARWRTDLRNQSLQALDLSRALNDPLRAYLLPAAFERLSGHMEHLRCNAAIQLLETAYLLMPDTAAGVPTV